MTNMSSRQQEKKMITASHLISLTLGEQRYALSLAQVERVIRALEITSLPKAPEIIMGVINVRGMVIPVINVRRRFHLPERRISPGDQIIISHTTRRRVALIVDEVFLPYSFTSASLPSARGIVSPNCRSIFCKYNSGTR